MRQPRKLPLNGFFTWELFLNDSPIKLADKLKSILLPVNESAPFIMGSKVTRLLRKSSGLQLSGGNPGGLRLLT